MTKNKYYVRSLVCHFTIAYTLCVGRITSVSLYNCIYFVRRQNYLMQDV